MQSLIEEKKTENSVSFVVDVSAGGSVQAEPEVKKRLEEQSQIEPPAVSLEQIEAKLEKAEEKRRASLHKPHGFDEKLTKVLERKSSLEKQALEHNTKIEASLHKAEENREQILNEKVEKVQAHLTKVDEVRK